MQAIEVSRLTKKFGSLAALNDIRLSVGEGVTFEFLGPNGAGKTTVIRILTGITRPGSGTAAIFGPDIEHDKIVARQSIGIVSKNSNVYDDLTAWQNIMFSAELHHVGRKGREEMTNELLRKLVNYAQMNKLKIVSIATLGPSLEDVFIKLTEL
jgi:ABC-2 type transport system ATP-binding protein